MNGDGKPVDVKNIPAPSQDDKIDMIIAWTENGQAPARTLVVSRDGRIGVKTEGQGYLLCSYPEYPKYTGGPADLAASYTSASPAAGGNKRLK